MQFNFKKCQFLTRRVEFSEHVVKDGFLRPSKRKIEIVEFFHEPTCVSKLQSFLGRASYFRKFIPNLARIARPLTDLLRCGAIFDFGPEQKTAFGELKLKLTNQAVLYEIVARTKLYTDTSKRGYGAILFQMKA